MTAVEYPKGQADTKLLWAGGEEAVVRAEAKLCKMQRYATRGLNTAQVMLRYALEDDF